MAIIVKRCRSFKQQRRLPWQHKMLHCIDNGSAHNEEETWDRAEFSQLGFKKGSKKIFRMSKLNLFNHKDASSYPEIILSDGILLERRNILNYFFPVFHHSFKLFWNTFSRMLNVWKLWILFRWTVWKCCVVLKKREGNTNIKGVQKTAKKQTTALQLEVGI